MTAFLPEIIALGVTVALLCLLLAHDASKWFSGTLLWGSVAVLAGSAIALGVSASLFHDTYRVDLLSQGFKLLIATGLFFTAVLSRPLTSVPARRHGEYALFLFTGTLGMMMLASAADLLTLYVSLELSSYSLYLLAGLKRDARSAEAGVKYLIFGAAASGAMLWGFSLLAGLSGTTSLALIAQNAASLSTEPAFVVALALVSFSFLFKLSGFPFHFWAPDVYETAATPAVNFIATASKAAAVAILVRVFASAGVPDKFVSVLAILAFLSMTVGNTASLLQRDAKRLLAYSSVAQAGYILVGLLSASPDGYASSFFYAAAYILMNTGAFFVIRLVSESAGNDNPQVSDFDGLAERSPLLALVLLLSLLSLAGIPPLAGFTGKWILFTAAMEKGHWFLVLWAVLNSVVSLFYYLTLVRHAYLEKAKTPSPLRLSAPVTALCLLFFFSLILLGVFPAPLITFAQHAIASAAL